MICLPKLKSILSSAQPEALVSDFFRLRPALCCPEQIVYIKHLVKEQLSISLSMPKLFFFFFFHQGHERRKRRFWNERNNRRIGEDYMICESKVEEALWPSG